MKTKKQYKVIGGMSFDVRTNETICLLLQSLSLARQRVKLYYGDPQTGKDYCEEYDTTGRIGKSTGKDVIPLLITTSRSCGGCAVMDHGIVKIKLQSSGLVLYQHPAYVAPTVEIVTSDMPEYKYNTMVNGELHGRHKTLRSAQITASRIR